MSERIKELRAFRNGQTPELPRKLTAREEKAILDLDKLFKTWPKTLQFQAGTGGLNVLILKPGSRENYFRPRKGGNTSGYSQDEFLDSSSIVASFDVSAQGGDPW